VKKPSEEEKEPPIGNEYLHLPNEEKLVRFQDGISEMFPDR